MKIGGDYRCVSLIDNEMRGMRVATDEMRVEDVQTGYRGTEHTGRRTVAAC